MAKAKPEENQATDDEAFGEVSFGDGASEGDVLVDLSGVAEDGGYEALPRGIYPCEIFDCTYERSQSSNNPMWTLVLKVEEGEYAGRTLFHHLVFTEGGLPRVKKALARLGFNELLSRPFNPQQVADEGTLIGARCRARVDIRAYQGQPRNNVRDLLPPESGAGFLE